ncbi:MAG: ABC transporter [Phycisphaeraceae bacterium]|nr:ABC transporter [Phycisphaeraceae bacterium]
MASIETRNLTRRLPSGPNLITIIDDVNLSVAPGEFVAVAGPSGSGKSTLLALLAGLDRPDEGEVLIGGAPISNLSETDLALLRRRRIGFVFQSFQLIANYTAHENVMLPLELNGANGARRRAADLLERLGLAERTHHYPSELSGGEQQRVALARAFAASPEILLADEPTGNLDGDTGRTVLDALVAMRQEQRTTLVLVSHDDAVTSSADRCVHLRDGRLLDASPEPDAAAAGS